MKQIPENERQAYIDQLISKITRETNEDMIDLVNSNIMRDVLKRAKELKAGEKPEGE